MSLIRLDLRDLSRVADLDSIELLAQTIPEKVGSPFSIQNLALDLEVSHRTIKNWLSHLDALYYCFALSPYGSSKIRAVKKEQKRYLWDWSQVEEKSLRFENMVACLLLKACHFFQDTKGYQMELRYVRDTEKREIDFIVLKKGKPLFAVECKLSQKQVSKDLFYFSERLEIPMIYQVSLDGKDQEISEKIKSVSILSLCKLESLV